MTNFERYQEWAKRYADRIAKQQAENSNLDEKPKDDSEQQNPVLPLGFGKAFFLEGDFGKKIHEQVIAKYGSFDVINKVKYDTQSKLVKGSTPFYVSAVNEFLEPHGMRTATQADLERILKNNILLIKSRYEDSSLVLRTNKNPNSYLAEKLYEQLEKRGFNKNVKDGTPSVIPLFCLRLDKDNNSPHKLAFRIVDTTNVFTAQILNSKAGSYINPAEIDENSGLPNKVYDKSFPGIRQLLTINSGISRLGLYGYLNIGSDNGSLAGSDGGGRVVVVSGEATAGKNNND